MKNDERAPQVVGGASGPAPLRLLVILLGLGSVTGCKDSQHDPKASEWAAKSMPDVQLTLQDLEEKVSRGIQKRNILWWECKRLQVDPEEDPDYQRWGQEVAELYVARLRLGDARNLAYLEYFKTGLETAPNSTAAYQEKVAQALRTAQVAKELIHNYRWAQQ